MDDRLASPEQIGPACWRELRRAVAERGHDWRVMTLATVDGGRADARMVVLRDVDEASRTLRFYTDARSAKVRQLQACPQGTLVAWSRRLSWQLRLGVSLALADDGLEVSSRWARVQLSPAVHDYMAARSPGTPITSHRPERGARAYFAVVVATVDAMDWLELHPDGQRRARVSADGGDWLTP